MDATNFHPATPLFLNDPLPSTGRLVEFQGWNKLIPENYFPFPSEWDKRKRELDTEESEREYKRLCLGQDEMPTEEKAMAQFIEQFPTNDESWKKFVLKFEKKTQPQFIAENSQDVLIDLIRSFCSQLPPLKPHECSKALLLLSNLFKRYNSPRDFLFNSMKPFFESIFLCKEDNSRLYEDTLVRILQNTTQQTLNLQEFDALLMCLNLINWNDDERQASIWEDASWQIKRTAIHRTLACVRGEIVKYVKEHIQRFGNDRKPLEKSPEIVFTLYHLARLAKAINLAYSDIDVAVERLLRNCVTTYGAKFEFVIVLSELFDFVPGKLTTASKITASENKSMSALFVLNQLKGIIQNKAPFGKLSFEAERAICKIIACPIEEDQEKLPALQLLQVASEHNLFFNLPENLLEKMIEEDDVQEDGYGWCPIFQMRQHPQLRRLIEARDILFIIANEWGEYYNKVEFWHTILTLVEEGLIKKKTEEGVQKLSDILCILSSEDRNKEYLRDMDSKTAMMAHRAIVVMKNAGLFVHKALAPEFNEKQIAGIDKLLAKLKKKCAPLNHRRRQLDGIK